MGQLQAGRRVVSKEGREGEAIVITGTKILVAWDDDHSQEWLELREVGRRIIAQEAPANRELGS